MHRKARFKAVALAAAAVGLIYFAIAYLLLPTFWTEHERHLTDNIGSFLTTTPQGIPGDPINVGLVGERNGVLHAFAVAGWHPADAITLRSSIENGGKRDPRPARCRRACQHTHVRRPNAGFRLREAGRRKRRPAPPCPLLADAAERERTAARCGSAAPVSIGASARATTPARSPTTSAPTSTPNAIS